MFKNQYDNDVIVWSPQGRIHQLEYAMEAVKQGSAAIALKNKEYSILVALKRAPSELSSYQEKIITIDDHIGVAIAGLTVDGRYLSRLMRNECSGNKWSFDEPLPISRLVSEISLKMQIPTQRYGCRPYGAGLLVAGYDELGPHVYYLCPSSSAYDCKSLAIGSRSQSARTYLERHLDEISGCSLDELILHGLRALGKTMPNDVPITNKAYTSSTQLYNWYFNSSDLANLRFECNVNARKRLIKSNATANGLKPEEHEIEEKAAAGEDTSDDALDTDEELAIVKQYIYLMKVLVNKFSRPALPDEVFGFAVTYLKRFYLHHSVMDFHPREMMLTCLYMACKASDFPIGIQAFIDHIPRNQERYSHFILNSELFLLEALRYDLWVFTPYRPLQGLIIDLVSYQKFVHRQSRDLPVPAGDPQHDTPIDQAEVRLVGDLRQAGTELINLWYQTDICLTVHPSQFALAVLVELGLSRPHLEVESFVRDEICACSPVDKGQRSSTRPFEPQDSDDEEVDEAPSVKTSESVGKPSSTATVVSPEDRWRELSALLDRIRETVHSTEFIVDLTQISEEARLDRCRNPLYNLDSEEYAEAKARADSLLAELD